MKPEPTILVAAIALVGLTVAPVATAQDANGSTDALDGSDDPFADDEPLFNDSEDPFAEYEEQAQLPDDVAGSEDDGDDGQGDGTDGANGSTTGDEAQNEASGLTWLATLAAASLAGFACARERDR